MFMNTCASTFLYHLYLSRPVYVNRNRNNTHKDVNKHLGEYRITKGDYYILGFLLIVLVVIIIRLIYKLFKNENR